MQNSTEDLAVAAAMDDEEALACLYERFETKLLNDLTVRTRRNTVLAEDVASATWEKVAKSIRSFTPRRGGFEAWLFTIARNELAAYYRGTTWRREQLEGDMLTLDHVQHSDSAADVVERKMLAHRVVAEVEGLCVRQRKVLHYRFTCGFSIAETARLMDLKENAVKQLQSRATSTLRTRLCDADLVALKTKPSPQGAPRTVPAARVPAPPSGSLTMTVSGKDTEGTHVL